MGDKNTVFEKQLSAMGELAKFDITGNVDHLEEAHYLAHRSGMDGDEKTSLLNEPRLSEWYEDGFRDRLTDHAIGMMEGNNRESDLTVNAEPGQAYVGRIVDAGNRWHVDQTVILCGVEILVRHRREDLSSTAAGLINIGNTVRIFYPNAEMGIVEEVRGLETAHR
ncbi:hypothetical protein [Pseudomonas psychrophila]|uniref:Uncharacterized protein n=1 Tax=Pseudomonas psychrophila TaxID=122355 RepID=A0A8I1FRY5_9PSED|nr:hypothetical protein [Pseudomonas psychrophila]AVX93300.1 hypothetical protein PkP19E3_34815 [Pseudomonas koreensis]MBJ2259716.1 hypothetical protein [Pseudomonas psychrophila]